MQTRQYFNNTGGLNLQINELTLPESDAEEIINLHATSTGSWTSRGVGYQSVNTTALEAGAKITGLYAYTAGNGQSYLIAAAGSRYFTFNPSTGTTHSIGSGYTVSSSTDFITFQGLLITCNGVNAPQKWSGTGTMSALSGWPASIAGLAVGNPAIAALFANRVVFSGDSNNPSVVYISALENPENYTPTVGNASAGAIQIAPGDGQRITALKTYFLPVDNEEVLVIFKERSTYMLVGSDASNFQVEKISDEFGAVSPHSVVVVGSDLIFLSREGVTSLSTTTIQGNLTTSFLSKKIRAQFNALNLNGLNGSFALHLRNRGEIWWFVPEGSDSKNSLVLVYNYLLGGAWSKRLGITACCGELYQDKVFTGTYEGFVQQQLRGNTYAGAAISWRYRTGFMDFNAPLQRKRIRAVNLYVKQISQVNITATSAWDLQRSVSHQQAQFLTVVPEGNSSLFGASVYGQAQYDTAGVSNLRFMPSGSGKFFQLEFSGNQLGRPVELEGWTIRFLSGNSF